MTRRQKPKRKRAKFTNSTKVTLAALSVMGFIGGWDFIARLDSNKEAQASSPNAGNLPLASSPAAEPIIRPTPWPTVPPLAELAPIPTLVPTRTIDGQVPGSLGDTLAVRQDNAPAQIAPIPTLAALPTLAPLPTLPPPPPPPPPAPTWNGGGNFSGGS
jgi:hypothetical protein